MRIKIDLLSIDKNDIGYNYNYHISSFIYSILFTSDKYKDLHNQYRSGKFTFYLSRLTNNINRQTTLWVSSNDEGLIDYLYKYLYIKRKVTIDKCNFYIEDIKALNSKITSNVCLFRLKTPLFLSKSDNLRIKHLSPNDASYNDILFNSIFGKSSIDKTNDVNFMICSEPKQKLVDIKGNKFKGYIYDFMIEAPANVIDFNYNSGFGMKNPQGLGYVELLKEYNGE